MKTARLLPGGGTRYIPGWGGAARPLIPLPCQFKTIIADFITLFKTKFRFLIPYLRRRLKVAVTNCVAFLLCNEWKFNVPGINAKANGSQF